MGFVLRDASPSSCGMMRARLSILATLGACAALFAAAVAAQTRFEVRSAYVEPYEGVYQLNSTVDFDLPEGFEVGERLLWIEAVLDEETLAQTAVRIHDRYSV